MAEAPPPPPPPPPPPHGANPKSTGSGLPPGNYDIFVIPPHSSGSGFLYLPSLNTQRNSFLAGVGCTLLAILIWTALVPVLKQWSATIAASGGAGIMFLVAGVAVAAWAFGKTQGESQTSGGRPPPPPGGQGTPHADGQRQGGPAGPNASHGGQYGNPRSSSSGYAHPPPPQPPRQEYAAPPPRPDYTAPPPRPPRPPSPQPEPSAPDPKPGYTAPPPQPEYRAPPPQPRPAPPPPAPPPPQPEPPPPPSPPQTPTPSKNAGPDAASSWEKAREETRKREEARRRAEELRKLREEALRKKEEAERQARAAAEKIKWEQARAREKEAREREARERLAKEQADKTKDVKEREKREREARERLEREKRDKAAAAATTPKATPQTTPRPAVSPTKKYERPSARSYASTSAYDAHTVISSATSTSSYTESSYAPSISTARTSPPPECQGPYNTSDPDKIVIKAVYMYTTAFPKPVSQLVSGENNVTDGLVLRITTEGLFIDDDVRRVPQREWDVKAWGIKVVESGELKPHQVLRATLRDMEGKRYIFVLPSDQSWKLDVGLARLRKGSQVRSMGMSGIKAPEMKKLLGELGWI